MRTAATWTTMDHSTEDPAAEPLQPRAFMPGPQGGDGPLMRPYELMIIYDADLDDAAVQGQLDRLREQVESRGGRIATTDRWGRRRFAYEIDHKTEGYYFVANFDAPQETVPRINQTLRIGDEYVRGKVLRPQ